MIKQRYTFYIIALIGLFGVTACEKSGVNCITSNGKTIRQERNLEDFDSIDVRDYVNLFITQDSVDNVIVESGQNIISGITTEVVNHQLRIRNINKCNWLRSYDVPVNVFVSVKNLMKIYYLSSGNVTTTNSLKSNSLTVEIWGGSGTMNLDLDIFQGYFVLEIGTVDVHLQGKCAITTFFSGDYGLFQCENLKSRYTFVTNASSNDCYVNSSYFLEATIGSIGNIYYSGKPDSVITYINGSGKVISL
jgi:hypothetical protein